MSPGSKFIGTELPNRGALVMVGGMEWDVGQKTGWEADWNASSVLVYGLSSFIPIFGGGVQGSSIWHGGNSVLDLRV